MTYTFPPSLYPLRDYLKSQGADTLAFASARQAAFIAQQLLNTRVKFPDKGADMTSTLFLIQKAVTEKGASAKVASSKADREKALSSAANQILADKRGKTGQMSKKKSLHKPSSTKPNKHSTDFGPEVFAQGVHIFCDGAAVPNPGVGGWGVVVYGNGAEIASDFGGDPETTNNRMELIGLLKALEAAKSVSPELGAINIWCDSQYVVNGATDWRHKWKKQGWNKRGENSPKRGEDTAVKNVDLWIEIDAALSDDRAEVITIRWVKGHAEILGNERADELAEMGRLKFAPEEEVDALTAEYRSVMAE